MGAILFVQWFPCLRNLHQHAPEPSGTCLRNLHHYTSTPRNPPEPSEPLRTTGTFRNLPPEPAPHTGTLRNLPERASGTCTSTHRNPHKPSGTLRNLPEPSGTCLRNLHQHTPEPSGTLRNPPKSSGTFRNLLPEPTPAHTGTLQNPPEPSKIFHNLNSPEPSKTFLQNLLLRPAPAHTGAYHSKWHLPLLSQVHELLQRDKVIFAMKNDVALEFPYLSAVRFPWDDCLTSEAAVSGKPTFWTCHGHIGHPMTQHYPLALPYSLDFDSHLLLDIFVPSLFQNSVFSTHPSQSSAKWPGMFRAQSTLNSNLPKNLTCKHEGHL